MPRNPPVVGVPYVLGEAQNADGTTITATLNLNDAVGRFTITVVNTSATIVGKVRLFGPEVEFPIPPGTTVVPIPGARRWLTTVVSIESGA